jgi:hypothetical protein
MITHDQILLLVASMDSDSMVQKQELRPHKISQLRFKRFKFALA